MTGQQVMARLRERDANGDIIRLVKQVAAAHQVTLDELLGHDRTSAPSEARRALWEALAATGHWSFSRLARVFDRDHTTIAAGIDKHRAHVGCAKLVRSKGKAYRPPVEQSLPLQTATSSVFSPAAENELVSAVMRALP